MHIWMSIKTLWYLDWFIQVTTAECMQGDSKLFPRWIQIILDDLLKTEKSQKQPSAKNLITD